MEQETLALETKKPRDRSLETQLAKAKARYEKLDAQWQARQDRMKAKENKLERKKRTGHLIDLGVCFLSLLKIMTHEARDKWMAKGIACLDGKPLERRQASLDWARTECDLHDAKARSQAGNAA